MKTQAFARPGTPYEALLETVIGFLTCKACSLVLCGRFVNSQLKSEAKLRHD